MIPLYWKWCIGNLFAMAVFVAVCMLLQHLHPSEIVRVVGAFANLAWFTPLSCWLFDRQLKAETAAGLPPLCLHR